MGEGDSELRRVAWAQVFPFLRLFWTFKLATHAGRLLLGLACVFCCYVGGRVLDAIWLAGGGGVLVARDARQTEIDVYATHPAEDFAAWRRQTEDVRQQTMARALVSLGAAGQLAEARQQLATRPAGELLRVPQHEENVRAALRIVSDRLEKGLRALAADTALTSQERDRARRALRRAADELRLVLRGRDGAALGLSGDAMTALDQLERAAGEPVVEEHTLMLRTIAAQTALNNVKQSEPRGPFIELLKYQTRCFAGAVRGVCTFRWGFGGGPSDPQPTLLGSVAAAGEGILWFVTQRPWYALLYAVLHFAVFAFFGGAICRHAAVQAARDETISLKEALRFAREKYSGLLLAPVVPAAIFLLAAIAMFVGGVVTAIPFIGELLAGVLYGLALLGGFALAMILIATVLGLHLMWPTIAVEGSDAFDAVTHAVGYIGQRAWNAAFYTFALLLYGGVSFVMVRLIGLLLLKLTHVFSGAGMTWFGAISSARTDTITKLDAMWHMPAWSELPLLPSTGETPFWGTFFNAPLSGSETVGAFLIACWVYLVIGLAGAFVVSFFFCGSTQMYYLLRRDVDAVDYDEIFYEEAAEELPPAELSPTPEAEPQPEPAAAQPPPYPDVGEPPGTGAPPA